VNAGAGLVISPVFLGLEIRNSSEQVEQNTQALTIAAVLRAFSSSGAIAYSSPSLPPIPRQSCHPFQAKAATGSSEACHPLTG
jgi:hypothetical protein